jgi:hypothetical protein
MMGADFILSAILGALKPLWPYLIAALAALGALWKAHSMGAASERAKQAADQLDAIKDRREKDDEVNSLAPADVDSRLDKWLRDK